MKIYIQFVLLFSVTSLLGQPISTNEYFVKSTLNDFHLKGKVKAITTNAKDNNGDWVTLPFGVNEFYNQYVLEFNSKGLLIKQTNYLDYRGKLGVYNFVDNVYSNESLIKNQKVTIVNNGEDPQRVSSDKSFDYNDKNNLLTLNEVVKGKNSSSTYQTEFLYTNRLDEVVTKVNQVKSSSSHYVYNRAGNLISVKNTSFDGKAGLFKYFIYDNNSAIYKEETINNRKIITYFNADEPSYLQVFNEKQQLDYQVDFNYKNEIVSFKKSAYKNNQILLNSFQVHYAYDDQGNWIEAKISTDNQLKYVVNRKIQYY